MNRDVTQDKILRDLLNLLRRNWGLIAVCALVAVGAAVAYSVLKEPVYKASAEVQFVNQSQDLSALGIPAPTPPDPTQQAAADAKIITSPAVVRGVMRSLDGQLSEAEIRDSVTTAVDPDTNLVIIEATAGGARLSAQLANAFAQQSKSVTTTAQRSRLRQEADRLQRAIRDEEPGSLSTTNTLQRIEQVRSLANFARPVIVARPAITPAGPDSPKPVRNAGLALVLGLIFGTLAAFLRDSLNRRLTDAHEVQHQLQLPILGQVEESTLGGVGFSPNGGDGNSDHGIEPFRILRSNIAFLTPEHPPQTIAITSPVAEEGKSTVATGLATAGALVGKRVLLIECDLRRPVFAERLKLSDRPGLSDCLQGSKQTADVIRRVPVGGSVESVGDSHSARDESTTPVGAASGSCFTVITAGTPTARPTELLASERFRDILKQVKRDYDLVVVDSAPLLPVGDTLEVLPWVDAALVCIRLNQTTREQAAAAKTVLEHIFPRPTGIVITGVRPGGDGYYSGYYSSVARESTPAAGGADVGSRIGIS